MHKVVWDQAAVEDLRAIDKSVAVSIVNKVSTFLCNAPDKLGKPLRGDFKGLYRYRYGDYRIIYELNRLEITIIIVKIGHRKSVCV